MDLANKKKRFKKKFLWQRGTDASPIRVVAACTLSSSTTHTARCVYRFHRAPWTVSVLGHTRVNASPVVKEQIASRQTKTKKTQFNRLSLHWKFFTRGGAGFLFSNPPPLFPLSHLSSIPPLSNLSPPPSLPTKHGGRFISKNSRKTTGKRKGCERSCCC